MEENKYLCPKCSSEMIQVYEKPALNLTCPKCNCKIATTRWDEIDLDDTKYEIVLKPTMNYTIDNIKLISLLTGLNYIDTTNLLKNGGRIFLDQQLKLLKRKNIR